MWNVREEDNKATDDFGFSALPGGYYKAPASVKREAGIGTKSSAHPFGGMGYYSYWWSAGNKNSYRAPKYWAITSCSDCRSDDLNWHQTDLTTYMVSVRCVQGEQPPDDYTSEKMESDLNSIGIEIVEKIKGDLNNDGLDDEVWITKLSAYYRGFIINIKTGDGYKTIFENHYALGFFHKASIEKGNLIISYDNDYFEWSYNFKYKNDGFELIGFEKKTKTNNNIVMKSESINFLTQRILTKERASIKSKFKETKDNFTFTKTIKLHDFGGFSTDDPSNYIFSKINMHDKGESERIEVKVKTVEELIRAIGSNRNILLEEGIYNLSNHAVQDIYNEHINRQGGLYMSNLQNMSIRGTGSKPSDLIVDSKDSYVMSFSDSKNISIENVTAGHSERAGECEAGVFRFSNSSDIKIDKTHMYGSGTIGLDLYNVTNMEMTNSTIYNCTQTIMQVSDIKNVYFKNCVFRDNKGYSMVDMQGDAQNVVFDGCEFRNNSGDSTNYSFTIPDEFTFKGCVFEDNIFSAPISTGDL